MSQILASFGNLTGVKSCRYTQTLGVIPDIAVLRGIPQSRIQSSISDLNIYGPLGSVFFPDCLLDSASMTADVEHGQLAVYRIFDRRWRWKFGATSKVFNYINPDGSIDPSSEASPREIANFLMQEAGEENYDVKSLPDDDRPYIDMTDDNPMQELESLCRQYGCSVAINGWKTEVVKIGNGSPLTGYYVKTLTYGIDPPELPSLMRLSGGDLFVQSKLKLQAVGKEVDGQIVPIGDLSYKPAAGWGVTPNNIIPEAESEERSVAMQTVFKWYRIESQADGTQVIPGYTGEVTNISSIIPVERYLLDFSYVGGRQRNQKAYVEGEFWRTNKDPDSIGNVDQGTIFSDSFFIDNVNGLVVFIGPVYKLEDDILSEADLYLTTSYRVKNEKTLQYVNYQKDRQLGDNDGGTTVVKKPDITPKVIIRYDPSDPTEFTSIESNQTALDERADRIISNHVDRLQTEESFVASYADIHNIESNGANRQVTWNVNDTSGATTTVYRNIEGEPGVLKDWERNVINVSSRSAVEKELKILERRKKKESGS